MNIKIEKCGLFLDKKHPYLGASPDGLVGEDVCVEVKCPYSARDMTVKEAINNGKVKYITKPRHFFSPKFLIFFFFSR